ncbi:DNA fragmentation factor subunit beta isoform X3 [Tiliqua scincoides]|uniref:DNA fragmentation factor subunit beta isoform X3 n=1 Tax=Tiliqua scincoides TaxID=71010 RepID=UPI0034623B41
MPTSCRSFKLRSLSADRKYGVAARSLQELLSKACLRLQLPLPDSRLCFYEDGAEVTEDHFWNVPDNTELILLGPGETWQGYVSEIQRFLNAFSNQTDKIVRAAQGLLSEEEAPKRRKLLSDLIQNLGENISAESRGEDEKWFEGVESRFKTKSSYMRYSCESRIRGYMKEVGSYTSVLHPALQVKYKQIVESMLEKLKLERIEKKRTILPTLAEALKERDGREVDWEYFYRLLFTVDNLKLVHIACHKKSNHNLACDKTKIYRKRKRGRRIPK